MSFELYYIVLASNRKLFLIKNSCNNKPCDKSHKVYIDRFNNFFVIYLGDRHEK